MVAITLIVSDGHADDTTSFTVTIQPRQVLNTNNGGVGSLRQAIDYADPGDVIGFDVNGVFATPQTINLDGQIVIGKSLNIFGLARRTSP